MSDLERLCGGVIPEMKDLVGLVDEGGIILEANRRWLDVLGYDAVDLVGRNLGELVAHDAVEHGLAATPLRHRDGRVVYVELSDTPIDLDGRKASIAIGRDVTAYREAVARAEASERKYRALVEGIPDVLWSAGPDGALVFVGGNVERVLGYTAAAVLAQQESGIDTIHPVDRERVNAAFLAYRSGASTFDVECRRRHAKGHWVWLQMRATARRVVDGVEHVDGVLTDISERKLLEEQIRQSQKLEAIGLLSGGIAHDFNNLLSVIISYGQFLVDDLAAHDPRRADAEAIVSAGERASALTRQLLAFSRRQVLEPTTTDLDAVVGGVDKMLRRLIGEDVELIVRGQAPHTIRVDVGQLEQVIMNLAVNARDAMPSGGRLVIDTEEVEVDEHVATEIGCPAGSYAVLSVSDTGCGMDDATRARIFEPFFTTKPSGHGTGLGLSTVYGIVRQSGGAVTVYSEPGLGTVFRVFLPLVDAPAATRARRQSAATRPGGHETVLVVEDDARVRDAVTRILENEGYTVLRAKDGGEAFSVFDGHAGRIDLLLSDVILPGTSGPDIATGVQLRSGETRVLFMSGYTDHPTLREGVLRGSLQLLHKPFSRTGLVAKVREILDAA
jgi:PAS domain S-box-containing protein